MKESTAKILLTLFTTSADRYIEIDNESKIRVLTPCPSTITTVNIFLFFDRQKNGAESLLESQMNTKYDFFIF
jgi:hypothetical protein